MLFTQPRFLIFFLIVPVVHWWLRRARLRKLWLLAASYFFYAAWDWQFLSLIAVATVAGYVTGRMMDRQRPPGGRRNWLVVSLIANLGILSFFKYFNFFVDSGAELLLWLGLPAAGSTLKIILPAGISFFTFQTIGYTIDVYRRRMTASSDPGDFALFVAFFPQLVAGPIVRATNLLPQLAKPRRWAGVDVRGSGFRDRLGPCPSQPSPSQPCPSQPCPSHSHGAGGRRICCIELIGSPHHSRERMRYLFPRNDLRQICHCLCP